MQVTLKGEGVYMRNVLFSWISSIIMASSLVSAADLTESGATSEPEQPVREAVTASALTSIGGGYGFLVRGEGEKKEIMLAIDTRWPDDLNFVGGAQQKGELPHETFARKIQEKTGSVIGETIPLGHWQRTHANDEGANDICSFFAGVISEDSSAPVANPDFLSSVHWFSLADARKGEGLETLFPSHLLFLQHFLDNFSTLPRQLIKEDFEDKGRKMVVNFS